MPPKALSDRCAADACMIKQPRHAASNDKLGRPEDDGSPQ
jgi:hypothetical protein